MKKKPVLPIVTLLLAIVLIVIYFVFINRIQPQTQNKGDVFSGGVENTKSFGARK